jgi:hypothetical protein
MIICIDMTPYKLRSKSAPHTGKSASGTVTYVMEAKIPTSIAPKVCPRSIADISL